VCSGGSVGLWAVGCGLRCNMNRGVSVGTALGCGLCCNMNRVCQSVQRWAMGCGLRCNMNRGVSVGTALGYGLHDSRWKQKPFRPFAPHTHLSTERYFGEIS